MSQTTFHATATYSFSSSAIAHDGHPAASESMATYADSTGVSAVRHVRQLGAAQLMHDELREGPGASVAVTVREHVACAWCVCVCVYVLGFAAAHVRRCRACCRVPCAVCARLPVLSLNGCNGA